jgi:hypothetical protein
MARLDAAEGLDAGADRRAEDDEVGPSKIVAGLRQHDYVDVSPSPSDGREKILRPRSRSTA